MKRQIQFDPQAGKNIKLVEDTDGSQRIESTQNFDTLLKINKQMSNDWRYGQMTGSQKHMQHVAEIPNVIYNELLNKFGKLSENPKAWKQWLNDNQNRDFRTGGGNI
tara:strand:+ start:113 stop:433 length:321 start_codon:yes stop_codon:yes gene_type:complete